MKKNLLEVYLVSSSNNWTYTYVIYYKFYINIKVKTWL